MIAPEYEQKYCELCGEYYYWAVEILKGYTRLAFNKLDEDGIWNLALELWEYLNDFVQDIFYTDCPGMWKKIKEMFCELISNKETYMDVEIEEISKNDYVERVIEHYLAVLEDYDSWYEGALIYDILSYDGFMKFVEDLRKYKIKYPILFDEILKIPQCRKAIFQFWPILWLESEVLIESLCNYEKALNTGDIKKIAIAIDNTVDVVFHKYAHTFYELAGASEDAGKMLRYLDMLFQGEFRNMHEALEWISENLE